jgi:hypothetical protein
MGHGLRETKRKYIKETFKTRAQNDGLEVGYRNMGNT